MAPRFTPADLNAMAELAIREMTDEAMAEFETVIARVGVGPGRSLRNVFLMWLQDPDVSCVMGFNAWKEHGRKVRKGGKGLAIIAPLTRKAKTTDGDTGRSTPEKTGEPAKRAMFGVKVVYVFDVTSTEPIDGEQDTAPQLDRDTVTRDDIGTMLASFTRDGEEDVT